MRRVLPFALLLAGCGGSPSAPSVPAAPAPMAVEVRDGWTGAPVSVTVPPALPGSTVSVSAPGYLTRIQVFNGPVYLWPQDEAFVRQLVYGDAAYQGVLTRWDRGFSIAAPGFENVAAQVAAEVSRATGLAVTSGGTTGNVIAYVDEADAYWSAHPGSVGYGVMSIQGHTVISAKIIFRSRAWGSRVNTFLHEMGHQIGLSHIEGPDVMNATANNATAFSERETIALRMMYERRTAGNAPPDKEGLTAASGALRTVVIE